MSSKTMSRNAILQYVRALLPGGRERSVPCVAAQPKLPYPVAITHRDIEKEAVAWGGGLECFETPGALGINRARLEHLDSLGLDLKGKRVLDVGCGVGYLAQLFVRHDCEVVCVDGREENIRCLKSRHPRLEAFVADVETDPLTRFGMFDIVFCYGLLYHLSNPLAGLRNMATVCRQMLLLETCVCDHSEPVLYLVDEPKSFNQALFQYCTGSRPSPGFVTMAINRCGFPYVYAPDTPPVYPDFQFEWKNNLDHVRDGHPIRCIFVASRQQLHSDRLKDLLARC